MRINHLLFYHNPSDGVVKLPETGSKRILLNFSITEIEFYFILNKFIHLNKSVTYISRKVLQQLLEIYANKALEYEEWKFIDDNTMISDSKIYKILENYYNSQSSCLYYYYDLV